MSVMIAQLLKAGPWVIAISKNLYMIERNNEKITPGHNLKKMNIIKSTIG